MLKTQLVKTGLIALTVALASAGVARAAYVPIPLTSGFNADVIVESNATPVLKVVTTASVDNGVGNTANTWMEQGFDPANPTFGLPPAGTVITAVSNANYTFQMPPSYTAPNGILIDTVVTNGTLTLTTPAAYTLLSFLGSGGNGGDGIGVLVNHADGTSETGSFGCPDWFNGTSNVAVIANERCGSTTAMTYANVNSVNPRLYFRDMALTNTSPVTNIVLSYLSGGSGSHNDIMAVSGATTLGGAVAPIAVTGFDYDFIVEASASKRGRTTAVDGITMATSATMDTGTGNTGFTWFEQGLNYNDLNNSGPISATSTVALAVAPTAGLPHAGSTVANAAADHTYVMPSSYTANNALLLSAVNTTGTLTFVAPTSLAALSFLAAGGSGGAVEQVVAHHMDGTLETNYMTVPDWFNDSVPYVIAANGRIQAESGQWSQVTNSPNMNPRMFNVDVLFAGDTGSPVTSVDINHTNTGAATVVILAVSSTTTVAPLFVSQPSSVVTNAGATVLFTASATANVPITYRWQKGTNGVFVNLTDGGNVSGSTTTTLTLSGVGDPDAADYQLVATDVVGSTKSGVASLVVLSTLSPVTVPGDSIVAYQPNGGSSPAAESVIHAIDEDTTKYLNFGKNGGAPYAGPTGFIVTPAMGRTRVSAIQLITANDAPERDPAIQILEGSDDGGTTWTLIYSNIVNMPTTGGPANDGRNPSPGTIDNTTIFSLTLVQQKFVNLNGYTLYRWSVPHVRSDSTANSMQIGEVRLLGVADTSGKPSITGLPTAAKAYNTTNVSSPQNITIAATVTGTPTPTMQWQRDTGSGFVNLSDGGNIAGSHTATLVVSPTSFGDAGNYRLVASNTSGTTTSTPVLVSIFSTLATVTQPTDPITEFGDQSNGGNGAVADNPPNAIDATTASVYQNGGSGLNSQAGFAPFAGPVGLVVTPAGGPSLVSGVRIYTSNANTERDPADYKLEGSNDGGAHYTVISSGSLALPLDRNAATSGVDPITQAVQELRFANSTFYTSYRVTFNNARDNNAANSLQFSEMELLGVVKPILTFGINPDHTITITPSWPGELQSTTLLQTTGSVWVDEGPITQTGIIITPSPSIPQKYYRVKSF